MAAGSLCNTAIGFPVDRPVHRKSPVADSPYFTYNNRRNLLLIALCDSLPHPETHRPTATRLARRYWLQEGDLGSGAVILEVSGTGFDGLGIRL